MVTSVRGYYFTYLFIGQVEQTLLSLNLFTGWEGVTQGSLYAKHTPIVL